MKFGGLIKLAFTNLGRVRTKTVLAVIGVTIGCATIVILMSLGIGVQKNITKDIKKTFTSFEQITVLPFKVDPENPDTFFKGDYAEDQLFNDEDVSKIKAIEGVKFAYAPISFFATSPRLTYSHVSLEYIPSEVYDYRLSDDDVFVEGDSVLEPGSVALNAAAADELEISVGETVKVTIMPPSVDALLNADSTTGITKTLFVRAVFKDDADPVGYVHADDATAWREEILGGLPEEEKYESITVDVEGLEAVEAVNERLKQAGYFTLTLDDILAGINKSFRTIQYALGAIGGISLLVALFGIANTMVMTVLERTREIGILKALGMTNGNIRLIFLVEAGFIGLFGGIIGLFVGWGMAELGNYLLKHFMDDVGGSLFGMAWWLPLGVVVFAVVVSMLAGLAPATRASRIDPVEALRSY